MRASSGALTLSVGLGFGYDGCSVAPSSRPWFWIAYVPSIAKTSENDRSGGLQVSECLRERQFKSQDSIMARCRCLCVTKGAMFEARYLRVATLEAVRRWYGPSGCVRRLRRLLEEESAVRNDGGRWASSYTKGVSAASTMEISFSNPWDFWTSVGGSSG
jgi:hypothetical protein